MYHHQALPFSMHSIHPADLTDTSSQAMLAEVSSIPMYWDQIEFPYGASDTDLPFLACLTAPSLNLDTCNLLDDKNFDEQPPHFTDLLATVTTYQRNLDQQVLQEKTNPLIAVCGQTLHLWEFVRDLLLTPQRNQETVRWENRKEGTFRVIKSDMFAQLWGEQKNNKCMNYEKLSRALRHYYKTGILERVDGRLTYKFGRKAHGWREDSPQQST